MSLMLCLSQIISPFLCFKSSGRLPSSKEALLSRQLEGIAKAKAEGKYRGGIPTARAKAVQVFALIDAGKTREAVAEELGISIRSVFRILRTRKDAEKAPVSLPVMRIRTRPQIEA
jgi:DNA invertase Pin-like site-specific DNA recombinase